MDLSKEFITENGLSEDQVTAIQTATNDNEATLKKGWDGKANENAERILAGASDYIKEKTGVELDREQGEKAGDYINRITDVHFKKKETDISTLKSQYEDKIKNFQGDDDLKTKNEELETTNDGLLVKLAKLDGFEGLDVKNVELQKQIDGMNLSLAIGKVKPTFAESVNQYEATAKWDVFMTGILDKYDIKIVEGVPKAISKDNIHSQKDLIDLVKADETLKPLIAGRQQTGPNGKPKDFVDVAGVPFKIPKEATTIEISKIIRDYLSEQGIDKISDEYTKEFAKWNLKIGEEKKKSA